MSPMPPFPPVSRYDIARYNLGREIALHGEIERLAEDSYSVPSQSGLMRYRVELSVKDRTGRCPCPYYRRLCQDGETRSVCKHVIGAWLWAEWNGKAPKKPKLSYKQNNQAFNLGQRYEEPFVTRMLRSLCESVVPEPNRNPILGGRPDFLPAWLRHFSAVMRVYRGWALRRSESNWMGLADQGIIPRVPTFNVPSKLLMQAASTPVFDAQLTASGAPCAGLEEEFAIDSTGLSLDAFGPYLCEKHHHDRKHRYMKFHIIVGCRSHIIVGAIITEETGEGSSDTSNFEPLIEKAKRAGFTIRKVTADAIYCSRANLNAATAMGAQPFIPFSKNHTSEAGGSPTWHKLFYLYHLHRDLFDSDYHQRSNVEAVISSVKRKIADKLRSRRTVSRINEAYSVAIAYNLTILVHELFEHGIRPDFLFPDGKIPARLLKAFANVPKAVKGPLPRPVGYQTSSPDSQTTPL